MATPIGNLEDITLRALRVLKEVDLIACEDTRVTGQMLKHFEIKKPLISYFQHSKLSKIEYIIDELKNGKNIALVTDAGTPGISDPGQELIAKIRNTNIEIRNNKETINSKIQENIKFNNLENSDLSRVSCFDIRILPVPGPSALAGAASVSGLIEKEFFFAGFLPKKKGRQTKFKSLKSLDCPIIIYESAMRLARTLEDIKTYFGDGTEVFIAREMTKMFEEYWGGNIDNVIADLKSHRIKGEVVLVVKKIT